MDLALHPRVRTVEAQLADAVDLSARVDAQPEIVGEVEAEAGLVGLQAPVEDLASARRRQGALEQLVGPGRAGRDQRVVGHAVRSWATGGVSASRSLARAR